MIQLFMPQMRFQNLNIKSLKKFINLMIPKQIIMVQLEDGVTMNQPNLRQMNGNQLQLLNKKDQILQIQLEHQFMIQLFMKKSQLVHINMEWLKKFIDQWIPKQIMLDHYGINNNGHQ